MIVHPDVLAQADRITLDPMRPLILSDADEVLVQFASVLDEFLHENELYLDLVSFALTGNIKRKADDVAITAEEAVVHKSVESAGAIQAHKVSETSTEQVRETLRKEDVEVERSQNKDQPHDDPATPFPDEDRY